MRKNNTFRRAAALMAALSITVSLAAPAFADTYYIDYGDITITKNEDGSQTIKQGVEEWTDKAGEETVITTSNTAVSYTHLDVYKRQSLLLMRMRSNRLRVSRPMPLAL